ncbi:MAG: helix-turn-helix domain-containing protein [Pseudomonadota bacterium]|nr:helix-turn-helix domain-containing protein [Pseudomonadota bacterium]
MSAGNQAFWLEQDKAMPIALPVCPCCQRPMPVDAEVFDQAIDLVEAVFGVTRAMVMGGGRARTVTKARALIVWGLRRLRPDLSYAAIGRLMERHHSTIVELHQIAIARRLACKEFDRACHRLVFMVTGKREQIDAIN